MCWKLFWANLNWKINCDDHSSLSSTTTVQIWIISRFSYTLHILAACVNNTQLFIVSTWWVFAGFSDWWNLDNGKWQPFSQGLFLGKSLSEKPWNRGWVHCKLELFQSIFLIKAAYGKHPHTAEGQKKDNPQRHLYQYLNINIDDPLDTKGLYKKLSYF